MSFMKCPLCEGKAKMVTLVCLDTALGRASLAQAMSEIFLKIKQAIEVQPDLAEDPGYEIRFNTEAQCPLCEGLGKIDTDDRRVKNIFHVSDYEVKE